MEVLTLGLARAKESLRSSNVLVMYVRSSEGEPPAANELEFRAAEPGDGERYALDIGTESPSTFRARLSGSTRCYLVIVEQRFVHSSWVTTRAAWTREIRRFLRPPEGDAYVYESFTRPEMRGKGMYPFALGSICAALARDGIKKIWVAVEEHNKASQSSIAKAGFAPAFNLPYERKLGRLKLSPPTGRDVDAARAFVREA
jgi:Acetyltransferase (GNAT) family